MRAIRITVVLAVSALLFSGCESQKYQNAKLRNRSQLQRIDELESRYNVARLKLAQARQQLSESRQLCAADANAMKEKISAMETDIKAKAEFIKKMQTELIRGGAALPPELAGKLEKFAATSDMITFNASSGMVKFKSDLLFNKGSAVVASDAAKAIVALCGIINSSAASNFNVVVVGHTDDVPIRKPSTRAMYPNNWYLSVDRAISVEEIMEKSGVSPKRMSVKGYGQYKPIAPNAPGHKGNPKNRRVEIYLVAA